MISKRVSETGRYGVAMAMLEKGTYDELTWFNIFFLPPETAKQLKSAQVEIITVQTYEDE